MSGVHQKGLQLFLLSKIVFYYDNACHILTL
jgi:hypothetical protein